MNLSSYSTNQQRAPLAPLERFEMHIARKRTELELALDIFSAMEVQSMAVTIPFLPDARFCDCLAEKHTHLQELSLAAYSASAAWRWPDSHVCLLSACHIRSMLIKLVCRPNTLKLSLL